MHVITDLPFLIRDVEIDLPVMNRRILICLFFFGPISVASICQTAASRYQQRSYAVSRASIQRDKTADVFVTENSSFDFVRLLRKDGTGVDQLLISKMEKNEWAPEREETVGLIRVSAWLLEHRGKRERLWSVRTRGNQAKALSDLGLLQVSTWSCCSRAFSHSYFSLRTGKQLYQTNETPQLGGLGQGEGLIRLEGGYNNERYTETRYIGFGSDSVAKPGQLPSLQYGTDGEIKQRLVLHGIEYGDSFDVPKLSVSSDGEHFSSALAIAGPFNCVVRLQFGDGREILVPIKQDELRADQAVLPVGLTLTPEKLDHLYSSK